MPRARSGAHFDENQCAVALAHDQIDFAAAGTRAGGNPIIALNQRQAVLQQMLQRGFFRGVADRLVRDQFQRSPAA